MAGILFLVFAVEAALLHSKNPVFLFWSTKKLMYWAALAFAGGICLWAAKKIQFKGLKFSCHAAAPERLFLVLQGLILLVALATPPNIGGDLEYQTLGLQQYLNGQVEQFNALQIPIADWDLALDRVEPIVWFPPGPMFLLLPLLKLGISMEWAIRWLLLVAYCSGGLGFLALTGKLGLSPSARLAFAVVLALAPLVRDGLGIIYPTSVDSLGMALFPWLAIACIKLVERLQQNHQSRQTYTMFLFVGFGVGTLYWVKYSWFIAGAALAGFLGIAVFVIVRKTPIFKRLSCMALFSVGFFAPFIGLNEFNTKRAGHDALQYSEGGGIGDNGFVNMVYGPNFSATARPQELPFSVLAGPGFILGGNQLATNVVNLAKNVPTYNGFFTDRGTNTHVWTLILLCLPMSLWAGWLLRNFASHGTPTHIWLLSAMVLIPIALLCYLSFRAGFNYLVKDNYRYVIPYSFLFQALLLDAWFRRNKGFHWMTNAMLSALLFWVILFPSGRAILKIKPQNAPPPETSHVNAIEQLQSSRLNDIGLVFFLNGHGPRASYPNGRSINVPFLLNGGIENDPKGSLYHTSKPIRVVVAIEANLHREHHAVQLFLNKFPPTRWHEHPHSSTTFPILLYADIDPQKVG